MINSVGRQIARAKVAQAQTRREAFVIVQRDARGNHQPNRLRHAKAARAWHRIQATTRVGERRIIRVYFRKSGAGIRKVKIKSQMIRWSVEVRPFDAIAVARLGRRNRASRVAILLEFGVTVEIPQRQGALQMGDRRGAHTDFAAFGCDQGRNRGSRRGKRIVRRNRLLVLGCTTRVVTVEPESTLYVKLGPGPRAENQTGFGAGQK